MAFVQVGVNIYKAGKHHSTPQIDRRCVVSGEGTSGGDAGNDAVINFNIDREKTVGVGGRESGVGRLTNYDFALACYEP